MILSPNPTILRRYTPPTCTLNIWATLSPLSRWTNLNIVDGLKFELLFDDPRLLDQEQMSITGNHEQLESLAEVVSHYVQRFLQKTTFSEHSQPLTRHDTALQEITHSPQLTNKGFLFHELDLGSLGKHLSRSSITLNSSQLFDLADALDSYRQDLQGIPQIYRANQRKTLSLWGSIAAVILLAVTIPLFVWPWYQIQLAKNEGDAPENEENMATNPAFLDVNPPVPPPPPETIPKLTIPPNIAAREQLPTPPPQEALPTPPRPQNAPLVAPSNPVVSPSPIVPPAPPRQVLDLAPQEPLGGNQVTILPAPLAAPKKATVEPSLSTANGISLTPELNLPNLPPLENPSAIRSSDTSITARSSQDLPSFSPPSSPSTPSEQGLLDPIPQVAEVRDYFQKTWKPPSDLNQTLEYRLLLGKNGSIQEVTPLGRAAALYQPQTAMPSPNQPFVSPLSVEGKQTLRLVLTPKGEVKTFLEDRIDN
ncbi:MAG: DUF4335 domain-containing protein [Microcystaceae cyanobacterium]